MPDESESSGGLKYRGEWAYRTLTGPVRDTLTRYRVVRRISAIFDLVLGPLALVTLCLLAVELLFSLSSPWSTLVYGGQVAIWAMFLIAFAIELRLAPRKSLYLRRNWILIVALVIPALRVLRVVQALRFLQTARALRGTTMVRSFAVLHRAMNAIRGFLSFSHTAFLAVLTGVVWLFSSVLVYYLESDRADGIRSIGDAFWWSAAVLTTIGPDIEPATTEGRIVAIAVRVFGIGIFGYLTARLAAFFLGSRAGEPASNQATELQELRRELGAWQAEIQARLGPTDSA